MFTRIVKRKSRRYLYAEWRWREAGKVRSKSLCLGAFGNYTPPAAGAKPGWLRMQFPGKQGLDWEAIERQQIEIADREKAKSAEFAAKMHAAYGMRMDTPIGPVEKVSSPVDLGASGNPQSPEAAAPSDIEGPAASDAGEKS